MSRIMRCLEAGVLLLLGAVLLNLIQTGSGLRAVPNDNISSADFISIILTALGVILAALAIFLGGLAIVSWRMFDDRVKVHSEEFLERRFSVSDPRYVDLVEDLKEDVRREIQITEARRKADLENLSENDEDVE